MILTALAVAIRLHGAPAGVPADSAKPAIPKLLRVASPWVGLRYEAPGPPGMQIVRMLSGEVDTAVAISEVVPKGPADLAGFKRHDLLVEFQGSRVFGVVGFRGILAKLKPGDTATFAIERDGNRFTGSLVVGVAPEP